MITINQHKDVDIVHTVKDEDGDAVDISGFTARFVVAPHVDGDVLLTKTTGSGIVLTTPADGILTISIDEVDTADLRGTYYYQIDVADGAGNESLTSAGQITITGAIAWDE